MTHKNLGNHPVGKLFIISAPAGTGKTTLARMASCEFPCVVENVSYTTRLPRPGELEGVDYFFVSKPTFHDLIEKSEFLEHATVFGELYGTSRSQVEKQTQSGKHVLLVIDVQGAMKLKKMKVEATFIFVKPPSLVALKQRLMSRKTDSHESIEQRLAIAQSEMEYESEYDYQIVNDNLSSAYDVLRAILIAEEHKTVRKKT